MHCTGGALKQLIRLPFSSRLRLDQLTFVTQHERRREPRE
ncbi:hypothetical protein T265_14708, partial [Opisthorchis viverrini]